MPETVDLAIVGAGPAGLAAAAQAIETGLDVTLIDEQDQAGGQIYRGIGGATGGLLHALGADYAHGRELLPVLSDSRLNHVSGATVWQVSKDREISYSRGGVAHVLRAGQIILATGALERAMPFPGWTLPGVMNAGAAQVLLKSSALAPAQPVVLAGSGPLLYLIAWQFLNAGAPIAALLETTPRANNVRALRHLAGALKGHATVRKGLVLMRALKRHGVPHHHAVSGITAHGGETLERVSFSSGGHTHTLPCRVLLVHQGVVPNVQLSRSLRLDHDWDRLQRCWRPRLDSWGETQIEGIYIAGDGAGIAGAWSAEPQGRLAALRAAHRLGALTAEQQLRGAGEQRKQLASHQAVRPFLDALYAPAREFLDPPDETVVCRCEEVSAGAIRGYVRLGCLGPNQTKAFGRPGMGPCQGRVCGLTVSEIIAAARGLCPSEIGYYRIRAPIKPLTLGELAALDGPEEELPPG